MTAFNAVRFRVKPDRVDDFIAAHKRIDRNWDGMRHANLIQTGDNTFCMVGEWRDMESLAAARPQMIATLDTFRDTLEDLGEGLGPTDPVSGPVILELR